jgi:hypothetical protein
VVGVRAGAVFATPRMGQPAWAKGGTFALNRKRGPWDVGRRETRVVHTVDGRLDMGDPAGMGLIVIGDGDDGDDEDGDG